MKLRTLLTGVLIVGALGYVVGGSPRDSEAAPTPSPAAIKLDVGDALQIVVVSNTSWTATSATVALFERSASGAWHQVGRRFAARIGRGGFSLHHQEGDGTSPAGAFGLVSAFGRQPNPGVALPYRQTQRGDCWISDSASPDYNRWVSQAPCTAPNEDLYQIGVGAYRYAIVTDFNLAATPGAGSAIFLHRHSYAANGTTRPTAGCVSFAERDLLTIMRWLDPAKHPRVVMGTVTFLKTGA